ncbi:MAG: CAP domain-containing protein [Patescibacteria group bacterium]
MRQIKTKIRIAVFFLGAFASLFLVFPAQASDITEQNVLRLSNEARGKVGLPDLQIDEQLTRAANLKVQDMLDKKYFAHSAPDGTTPWHWFSKVNYDYEYAGENLAIDFASAEDQSDAWMKSETHRKNILSDKYTKTGIAIAVGDIENHTSIITVQVFALPKGAVLPGEGEFIFSPDRKLDWENGRKGFVLSSQGRNSSSGKESQTENNLPGLLPSQYEKINGFLWTLVLLVASLALIINPIRLIGRSCGEIYEIVQEKIRRRLAWERSRARYEEWVARMRNAEVSEKDLDNLRSVRLRV